MVTGRREFVIPISFGDIYHALDGLRCAVKHRNLSLLTSTLWVIRENHRRGTWQPFTLGRYIVLRRRMAQLALPPELRGARPWWRHSDHVPQRPRQETP